MSNFIAEPRGAASIADSEREHRRDKRKAQWSKLKTFGYVAAGAGAGGLVHGDILKGAV